MTRTDLLLSMARRPKHFSAKSRQIRLSFRGFNINYVPSAPPLYATLHTENDHIRSRKSKVGEKFRRKKREKILWVHGKCVTLQRFRRETGRLAQLVQSVCLTSRGSGVRIPQRPPPRFSHRDAVIDTSGRGSTVIDLSCRQHIYGALSSAGSERLPYKQRVGGSNPSAPTTDTLGDTSKVSEDFFCAGPSRHSPTVGRHKYAITHQDASIYLHI